MSLRRGVCPSLSAPMQTGDGLLVRLNPVEGHLSGRQLAGVARAAEKFGNGILEITARGSLQVRGLTAESAAALGAEVDALGIGVRWGLPIDSSPLAGLDAEEVADPRGLAREIWERCEELGLTSRLGPKVSVTVDGGGVLGLGGVLADVKLEAVTGGEGSGGAALLRAPLCPAGHLPHKEGDRQSSRLYRISEEGADASGRPISPLVGEISGRTEGGAIGHTVSDGSTITWLLRVGSTSATARDLGCFAQADAAEAAVRILKAIAELGAEARARDLSDKDLAAVTGSEPVSSVTAVEPMRPPVGRFALVGGRKARGSVLSYGQIESGALSFFAEALGEERSVCLARGRGLIVLDVAEHEEAALVGAAERLGFVTRPDDPRLSIAVCAGKPACASAHLATRHLADRIVASRPDLLDGSYHLQLSGCGKQCARPSGPRVTLAGVEGGFDISAEGTAIPSDLEALLSELAEEQFRQRP
ncbi:nitrite/sulfite reductase [Chelativorans salis]|uniref:Nitrite/sulfite reductase n=1 Tax=Chelativorans salis TaxID=2978478 RepID=A0ABT2LUY4_9HYPH|nr:nitrite/sulfite reductase [Chelativorans sp. EGI FJ00035]MCT7377667.1 nitrite/sulfite reductase [Chelativorans sp. EGI FJ00035]